jgi:hypothetical protein
MDLKPFDKLDETQQRCCIDIAIGIAVIAARVPGFGKPLFKAISDQWAQSANLDPNHCKYALTGVSNQLFNSSWEFHVHKEGESMVCRFVKHAGNAGNGDFLPP